MFLYDNDLRHERVKGPLKKKIDIEQKARQHEPQILNKLTNIETRLKKKVAYEKGICVISC